MSLARSCDVIVIGGGAAGTAAAVGAAKAGAQTLLVESGPFLGGAATLKNVLTYCGLFTNYQKKQAVFGVADQVLQRLREMGAVSEPIQFHGVAVLIEPESVKYVLDQLCKHAGVQVCLHTMFLSATRNGNHITSVTLHDHGAITRSGRKPSSMPAEKETSPSLVEPPYAMGIMGPSRRGR
jgi:flavin-dependent dehydrogenase